MTEGEDHLHGFENSVHLDVHTKLCDLYEVFKQSLYIGSNVSSLSSSTKASSIA